MFTYSIVVSPDSVDGSGLVCLFCLAFNAWVLVKGLHLKFP